MFHNGATTGRCLIAGSSQMSRIIRSALWLAIAHTALCLLFPSPSTAASARKPSIIFILADDLGWAELGCYGNRFNETPHLDRLAGRGMRFTGAYAAAPVCSPYRASFIAGQYPARVGITDYLRPGDPKHLSTDQVTVAEMLKLELYNLAEDPGEQRNLAESMPDVARKLHQQLRSWRKSVGARGGP